MNILAFDTTTDHGSLALSRHGEIVFQHDMHSSEGYSHILFKDLHARLGGRAGLSEIDIFAAATGPGSFTGVRVGVATVKGLAEACSKGAIGVSNLQALASFGTDPLRAVLIDARRQECYAAVYDHHLTLCSTEMVAKPAEWLQSLPENSYQFVSQNGPWLEELLGPTRFANAPKVIAPLHIAAAIARCANLQVARGESTDTLVLDANYVRRSDVNLHWHDQVSPAR